jgi:hypothetical protein
LEELLLELTPRERKILELRYGLHGQEVLTLQEVGERLEITRERVRQLQTKAENKIFKLARKPDTSNMRIHWIAIACVLFVFSCTHERQGKPDASTDIVDVENADASDAQDASDMADAQDASDAATFWMSYLMSRRTLRMRMRASSRSKTTPCPTELECHGAGDFRPQHPGCAFAAGGYAPPAGTYLFAAVAQQRGQLAFSFFSRGDEGFVWSSGVYWPAST